VCQLNAGTSLGAIKVNNVLPWETVDADILLHPDNITAFEKLESTITQNGYRYVSRNIIFSLIIEAK